MKVLQIFVLLSLVSGLLPKPTDNQSAENQEPPNSIENSQEESTTPLSQLESSEDQNQSNNINNLNSNNDDNSKEASLETTTISTENSENENDQSNENNEQYQTSDDNESFTDTTLINIQNDTVTSASEQPEIQTSPTEYQESTTESQKEEANKVVIKNPDISGFVYAVVAVLVLSGVVYGGYTYYVKKYL